MSYATPIIFISYLYVFLLSNFRSATWDKVDT